MNRARTFVLALVYLAVILVVGLLYFVKHDLFSCLPATFGPVPVGVPWFGALGAVVISLTGVFEHEHDWDDSYWPWHVSRPLIGIALGVVSVLIMKAGVLAVGSAPLQSTPTTQSQQTPTPTPTPAGANATPTPSATATPSPAGSAARPTPTGSATPAPTGATPSPTPLGSTTPAVPGNLLYFLVAFLVGYREETFRELIKRLVDIILSPGNGKASAPTIHGVNPPAVPHAAPTPVTITGTGFTDTQTVTFGNSPSQFKVNADGTLTATPAAQPGPVVVTLTVTTKGGSANTQFTFN